MVKRPRALGVALTLALTAGALLAGLLTADPAEAQRKRERWWVAAERELHLGPGTGRRVMTKSEWETHKQQLESLEPEEREVYRARTHYDLVLRGRKFGILMKDNRSVITGEGEGKDGGT